MRWWSQLEEYDYTVNYLTGQQNMKANALSCVIFKLLSGNSEYFENIFDEKIYSVNNAFRDQIIE